MLRLRHSRPLQHQLLQHQPPQALNQCPVWNGVKTGEPRGGPVERSDVKRGVQAVRNDGKRGVPLVSSDVRQGAPLACSDARHGADCTCSPPSP